MAEVKSPIGGKIIKINVAVGNTVKENQSLLVLEAMKMEIDLPSPVSGIVKEIKVSEGQPVDTDIVLVVIEPSI
ncbi:MAG: acetyl-CoA carboxylase biotin carboxyl carrier protein subunit [Planctomycetota bacterium]|nr:acetyl-CoA carboxylase biotin carboxyl carrier protein subunit [Planctomycetota bacterium]MDI6788616.1 acetyl-CoA carboxylase biotin carboxyl carrier protein subunit [Planctomycetota bacterium]